jgi:hypothetical protein
MASMLSLHDQGKGPWILLHVVSGPWTSLVAALDKGQRRKAVCRRHSSYCHFPRKKLFHGTRNRWNFLIFPLEFHIYFAKQKTLGKPVPNDSAEKKTVWNFVPNHTAKEKCSEFQSESSSEIEKHSKFPSGQFSEIEKCSEFFSEPFSERKNVRNFVLEQNRRKIYFRKLRETKVHKIAEV